MILEDLFEEFIERNSIKKETVAFHYGSMIKCFFYFLQSITDLYWQIKEYIQIRLFTETQSTKLFVKSDGTGLKGVSNLEAALLLTNGEAGNVTGIVKNIIIKMIKADIRWVS